MPELPAAFIRYLDSAQIKYTLKKGQVFYHTVEDYKRGKDILDRLGQQNRQKYNSNKVRMLVTLRADSGMEYQEMVVFDSEDEAEYFFYLRDKQLAGEVTTIRLHPSLMLIPKLPGQMAVTYSPDFYVGYKDGSWAYVDVKGFGTQQGDLRRKIYNWRATQPDCPWYGVPLLWVATSMKYGDEDGWIGYDELQRIRAKNRKLKKGA